MRVCRIERKMIGERMEMAMEKAIKMEIKMVHKAVHKIKIRIVIRKVIRIVIKNHRTYSHELIRIEVEILKDKE